MESVTIRTVVTIAEPWLALEPVRVGSVPGGLGTPDVFVLVDRAGEPLLRIDVYTEHRSGLTHVRIWHRWAVIACADQVHLVALASKEARSFSLDHYCSQLYATEDRLLVASACELLCFTHEAVLVWRAASLGIDGVQVETVAGDVISGQGEWDPPDGWRPFRLRLSSGARLD